MPVCRPSQLRASTVKTRPLRGVRYSHDTIKSLAGSSRRRDRRHASTATALAPKPPTTDLEASFHTPIRTLLHKTTSFLPRVLPNRPEVTAPSTAAFWHEVLGETHDRLNSGAVESPARLVGE